MFNKISHLILKQIVLHGMSNFHVRHTNVYRRVPGTPWHIGQWQKILSFFPGKTKFQKYYLLRVFLVAYALCTRKSQ